MTPKEIKKIKVESILIIDFLNEYFVFEKLVKSIFQKKIVEVDHQYKSKLYFYYGGTVGNGIFIDFEEQSIRLDKRKYEDNDIFKSLPINKINNFLKKDKIINELDFYIESIQRKADVYPLHECCKKFTEMRNLLAHEIKNVCFEEKKHFIELLSISKIQERLSKWYEDMLDDDMSDASRAIASNIVYIRIIIEKLKKLNSELK